MMNRKTFARWAVLLCAWPATLHAAEAVSSGGSSLRAEPGLGRELKLSFPAKTGKRYQVFFTTDLKQWEPVGSAVEGRGNLVTVPYDTARTANGFFRVEERAILIPIRLQVGLGESGSRKIQFPTAAGIQYVIYASDDLVNWEVVGDLVTGTGNPITLNFDPEPGPGVFYRAGTADIIPIANMVRIPSGTFAMGSPVGEKGRDLDEDPITEVTLVSGFWMGKYEVTQREFERVMGNNPSWFKGDPGRPVESVNWKEAVTYCSTLTAMEQAAGRLPFGYVYRLPTEAEFEYACRAGMATRFSHGDDPEYEQLEQYAWFDKNSGSTSHPVGQKKPNPFGLHDMHGNIWEWCLDWYQDRYPGGKVSRPTGPAAGIARVFRGGGWDYNGVSCRSAFRNNVSPARRTPVLGFRVVLAPAVPLF